MLQWANCIFKHDTVCIKILVDLSKLFQKLYQGTSMNFNILGLWSQVFKKTILLIFVNWDVRVLC